MTTIQGTAKGYGTDSLTGSEETTGFSETLVAPARLTLWKESFE